MDLVGWEPMVSWTEHTSVQIATLALCRISTDLLRHGRVLISRALGSAKPPPATVLLMTLSSTKAQSGQTTTKALVSQLGSRSSRASGSAAKAKWLLQTVEFLGKMPPSRLSRYPHQLSSLFVEYKTTIAFLQDCLYHSFLEGPFRRSVPARESESFARRLLGCLVGPCFACRYRRETGQQTSQYGSTAKPPSER